MLGSPFRNRSLAVAALKRGPASRYLSLTVRFCTFEVATHVGRHCRVGAFHGGCIVDVNFATAWYLSQQGEPEPQRLANGLAPADMLEFLRAGLRSIHAGEELFAESGPPADWWRRDPLPRGPNDETIVYRPEEVRLCARCLTRPA